MNVLQVKQVYVLLIKVRVRISQYIKTFCFTYSYYISSTKNLTFMYKRFCKTYFKHMISITSSPLLLIAPILTLL